LAKWGSLNKLIAAAHEAGSEEVLIQDFPGGVGCFEMCAKYCYGITITLSPHNVGEVRCGAEYLQMTETTEKSNLIFKLEVFLNSSILRGWKDAIICSGAAKSICHGPKISRYLYYNLSLPGSLIHLLFITLEAYISTFVLKFWKKGKRGCSPEGSECFLCFSFLTSLL
jgi:hypothetical protein